MNNRKMNYKLKKNSLLVLALFYFLSVCACGFGENTSKRSEQVNSERNGVISKNYVWLDVNTRTQMNRFTLQVSIQVNRLEAAILSYGIPDDIFIISYSNKFERQKKILEIIKSAAEQGINISLKDNRIFMIPDYKWIISKSYEDIRPVFDQLYGVARKANYNDYNKIVGLYSSFVQNINYKVIPEYRIGKNGKKIYIGGVTMPVETLANGYGDCDTKSLLFAALLKHFRNAKVIFVEGQNHIFVGVKAILRPGDCYVQLGIDKYLLIELTDAWPLGEIPEKHWRGFQLKKFRVYRVV